MCMCQGKRRREREREEGTGEERRGGFMCEMWGEGGGNSFQCFNISPQVWGRG